MVFQDPMTSLNPLMTVGEQLAEVTRFHLGLSRRDARAKAVEALDMVGIAAAGRRIDDYPHEFSGGQRQRIGIAIALSCEPDILIADEPTTALDVTVQAQILTLVKELQDRTGMSVIWISHDLGVVAGLVDRVAVMYAGRIVEIGPVEDVFRAPRHPYTIGLLRSLPDPDADAQPRLEPIDGLPPDLSVPGVGCAFAPRCAFAEEACGASRPVLETVAPGHQAACRRWQAVAAVPAEAAAP
jgi:oligopeptide/dipeptide ABC transporter ATP-binding protein